METKKFKPFDKVLVREYSVWLCDLYSHYNSEKNIHVTLGAHYVDGDDIDSILPYEGNEELVGTTDSPGEEVKLEKGEWIMCAAGPYDHASDWTLHQFDQTREKAFLVVNGGLSSFAIRFSDFNPNDMEATKAKILCVKGGKVVRYKG